MHACPVRGARRAGLLQHRSMDSSTSPCMMPSKSLESATLAAPRGPARLSLRLARASSFAPRPRRYSDGGPHRLPLHFYAFEYRSPNVSLALLVSVAFDSSAVWKLFPRRHRCARWLAPMDIGHVAELRLQHMCFLGPPLRNVSLVLPRLGHTSPNAPNAMCSQAGATCLPFRRPRPDVFDV